MTDERGHFERGRWVGPSTFRVIEHAPPIFWPKALTEKEIAAVTRGLWHPRDLDFGKDDYVPSLHNPKIGDRAFVEGVGGFRFDGSAWRPASL